MTLRGQLDQHGFIWVQDVAVLASRTVVCYSLCSDFKNGPRRYQFEAQSTAYRSLCAEDKMTYPPRSSSIAVGILSLRQLRRWVRKLHLYVGLLTFSSLLLLGASGMAAFLHHTQNSNGNSVVRDRLMQFEADVGTSDVAIANQVRREFELSLALKIGKGDISHDGDGNLTATFSTINGSHKVTVFREQSQVRIVERRLGLAGFLVRAHSVLLRPSSPGLDWRVLVLSIYMATTLMLLGILVPTGLAIWLLTRPRHKRARLVVAASSGLFIALWMMI